MKTVPITWESIIIMHEHGWLDKIECKLSKKGKKEFLRAIKRFNRELKELK